jgi:hypothetical protein
MTYISFFKKKFILTSRVKQHGAQVCYSVKLVISCFGPNEVQCWFNNIHWGCWFGLQNFEFKPLG